MGSCHSIIIIIIIIVIMLLLVNYDKCVIGATSMMYIGEVLTGGTAGLKQMSGTHYLSTKTTEPV